MPTVKDYRRFGRRYMLVNAASLLPFAAVFAVTFARAWSGVWDGWTWASTIVFAAGGLLGLVWQHRRHTRLRCPGCDMLIVHPGGLAPGDPVNFICPRCDVEWVTGLRVPED